MESADDKRRLSRSRRYGCLTVVLLFIAFVVVIPIFRGSGHPAIDHEIHEFPGVESDEDIAIAVDADDEGLIHLAWSTPGLGFNYVSSADLGNSWSKSVRVEDDASVIDLFANGDTIVVLSISDVPGVWPTSRRRHGLESFASVDGGRSWSEPRQLVDRIDRDDVDLVKDGDHLYLAYSQDRIIYFMRSEDFGHTWSSAVEIGRFTGSPISWTFALTVSNSSIFVFWVEGHAREQGGFDSVPFILEGSDDATSWRGPLNLTRVFLGHYEDPIYGYGGGVVALDSTVFAFFCTGDAGIYGSFRPIRGGSWSPTRRLFSERSKYGRIDAVSHRNKVVLGIVGARFSEYDPIGYTFIPFFHGFAGWRNNDLDLLMIAPGEEWHNRIVTPAASRVSYAFKRRTKELLVVGDKLVVFWSGRKKVGRTLDAFGYKEQIFWAKFDLQSLG